MNREIKFRAWDGKYMFNNWFDCFIDLEGGAWEEPEKKHDTPNREIVRFENIILMQYTGLKDSEGKEIYEGDIIEGDAVFIGGVDPGNYKVCDAVDFHQGMFGVIVDKHVEMPIINPEHLLNAKVIGNIYENPELL